MLDKNTVTGSVVRKHYEGNPIEDKELAIAIEVLESCVNLLSELPESFILARNELYRILENFNRFDKARKGKW